MQNYTSIFTYSLSIVQELVNTSEFNCDLVLIFLVLYIVLLLCFQLLGTQAKEQALQVLGLVES